MSEYPLISDLLPRINPVGFLTLPGHSGRASLRGISAPVVHISFCVRAVIATAFCQDANITTAITCVLSLGKNLTYHAARFLVCTRDKYYTAIQQINVSINRQYGIHPTAKDRGLSACYDRNIVGTGGGLGVGAGVGATVGTGVGTGVSTTVGTGVECGVTAWCVGVVTCGGLEIPPPEGTCGSLLPDTPGV